MINSTGRAAESEVALGPIYFMRNPNTQIILSRSQLRLSTPEASCVGKGTIYIKWRPSPSISFKLQCDISHINYINLPIGPAQIEAINNPSIQLDVFVTNISNNLIGGKKYTRIFGDIAYPKTIYKETIECSEVKFHMINFIRYPGNLITDFDSGDWQIKIAEVNHASRIYDHLGKWAGYAITHTGIIKNKNGILKFEDVITQLDALYYFFAFLSGRWVGPVLSAGFYDGKKIWKIWDVVTREGYAILDKLDADSKSISRTVSGSRDRLRLTSGTPGWDWTVHLSGTELQKVFQGFMKKWNDESWRDPLKTMIFLYVEANQGSGGTEGSIILVQSALELLTAMEPQKINRGTDVDGRIRQYLKINDIPEEIPQYLSDLKNFCEKYIIDGKPKDGPRAISYVRNKITHANVKDARRLQKIEDKIKLQLSWLGIWYLEMAFLHLFDYNYRYANRLWRFQDSSFRGGLGFLQQVPWSNLVERP